MADYLALIVWLLRTADKPARSVRFIMRAVLIATMVPAIHLAVFGAFLSENASG